MENIELNLDRVKLWEIPYGAIISVKKEVIEENGYDNFKIKKDKYTLIKVGRFYEEGSIDFIDIENELVTVGLSDQLILGEDFELVSFPTQKSLEALIRYKQASVLYEILENAHRMTEKVEEEVREEIRKYKLLKEML